MKARDMPGVTTSIGWTTAVETRAVPIAGNVRALLDDYAGSRRHWAVELRQTTGISLAWND